jgi:serine kinase of HPr protein (carbohydrate metabolism regulator)
VIVREIVQALDLKVVAGSAALSRAITGGYCADLLSCVMARAKAGNVWATLQAHPNVIAVASLIELTAVVVTEGTQIPDEVIAKAEAEGIVLLSTPHTSFWLAGELARLGVKAQE